MNSRIGTTPSFGERMVNTQMVENTGDYHVYKVINRLRMMVETGTCGHDRCTCLVNMYHIIEVDE
jgi:hypothetical protein